SLDANSGGHASQPVNFVALVRPASTPTPTVDFTSVRGVAPPAHNMSHQAVNWPSSVAKCASENIRGKVRSEATATAAATAPSVFRRRNATTPHATLKTAT